MGWGYHNQASEAGEAVYSNGCRGKAHYSSKAVANAKIRAVIQDGHPDDGTLNAYKCRVCKSWHIGHRPGSGRLRRAHAG